MARSPIRPGEHLREELDTLGMSAAELSRQLDVPTNRGDENFEWPAGYHARHGLAPGAFFPAPARNSGSMCKAWTNCA